MGSDDHIWILSPSCLWGKTLRRKGNMLKSSQHLLKTVEITVINLLLVLCRTQPTPQWAVGRNKNNHSKSYCQWNMLWLGTKLCLNLLCMATEEGELQTRSVFYLKFCYNPIVQQLISAWHRQDAPLAAFLVFPRILYHLRVTINLSFVLATTVTIECVEGWTCPLQVAMSCPKERKILQHPTSALGSLRKPELIHVHHSTTPSSRNAIKLCV